jgi:hypothetical protein
MARILGLAAVLTLWQHGLCNEIVVGGTFKPNVYRPVTENERMRRADLTARRTEARERMAEIRQMRRQWQIEMARAEAAYWDAVRAAYLSRPWRSYNNIVVVHCHRWHDWNYTSDW